MALNLLRREVLETDGGSEGAANSVEIRFKSRRLNIKMNKIGERGGRGKEERG